jgi:hypothetical protein
MPDTVAGFTIWAWSTNVGQWLPVEVGLPGHQAVANLATRQDRVRRTGHETRFKVLPDDQHPDDVP